MIEYKKKLFEASRLEYYVSWVYASNARQVRIEYTNILNNASQILASTWIFK